MDILTKLNKQIINVEQSEIRQFNDIAHKMNAKYYITLGEPDFNTPDDIKNECINALNNNKTKYGPTVGNLELRKAIKEFEEKRNNVNYDLDEIIITTGSTEAITSALFTILNEDDEVIVPTPDYALYRPIIEFAKGKYVPIDTSNNNFQITKEMILSCITPNTKAIILNSPNNPTGVIYDDETLNNIHDIIKEKDIFVICDDCYSQLVYDVKPLNFSSFKDIKEKIIVCQSFSKPYAMPGWRIGYLLSSKEFCKQVAKIHQYMVVAVNTFIQDGAIKALSCDNKYMIDDYKKRRDYVYSRLINMGLEVIKPNGAFYIFPKISKFGISSFDFCYQFLEKKGVAIIPGSCFNADEYVRISYCVSMEILEKSLDLLEEFIKEF